LLNILSDVCITVYVESSNANVLKAVQEHQLLLKTLSRSSDVRLAETVPAGDCVSIHAGSDATLHLSVNVSVFPLLSVADCDQFMIQSMFSVCNVGVL